MRALCIDPGSTASAVVEVEVGLRSLAPPWGIDPLSGFDLPNEVAREMLLAWRDEVRDYRKVLVIETMPTVFGGAAARDQLKTERWAGRFMEASGRREEHIIEVASASAKTATVGKANADDPQVRAALLAAYGDKVRKCKRCNGGARKSPCPVSCADGWESPPGPLQGWTGSHLFRALALAWAAFRPGGVAEDLRNG